MNKKWFLILTILFQGIYSFSQQTEKDSSFKSGNEIPVIDSSLDFDDMLLDFDYFLDSILNPRSYFMASLSLRSGYYNFESKSNTAIVSEKKLTYSPQLAYYHHSGLGLSFTGDIVNDGQKANLYQAAITPSFDYLSNKKLATGISFSKYFTRDNLPFYNSPLQNDVYAYFTWRQSWIRPTLALCYGWGSRTEYSKRETLIQDIRLRRLGYTYINSKESISDFSVSMAARHDFYWLQVFAKSDFLRLSPVINLTLGTQKFGFNQSASTYATILRTRSNVLFSTEELILDDQIKFQPLNFQLSLRTEYSIGRFFIQPQYLLSYYFPGSSQKLTGLFTINAGLLF